MDTTDGPRLRAAMAGIMALTVTLTGARPVLADDDTGGPTAQEDSVTNRARPEYDPVGADLNDLWYSLGRAFGMPRIPQSRRGLQSLGTFDFFPKLEISTSYDDNIFRSATNKPILGEALFTIAPSLQIKSDWDNHSFNLSAGARIGKYPNLASEDFTDYFSNVAGSIDVTEGSRLSMNGGYSHATEPRSSVDDLGAGFPPTQFDTYNGGVNWDYVGDRLKFRAEVNAKYLAYSPAGPINNSDRNYVQTEGVLRPGWEFLPGTTFFVEPRANVRERPKVPDRNGFNRDSKGGQILAGITWDASGVTYFEAAGGYLRQDYEDPALLDVSGPTFNLRALWNATDLITLTLEGTRSVEETETNLTSGILRTTGKFTVDYELLENLLLNGYEKYTLDNFRGDGRHDRTSESGLGAKYLLNANMYLGLTYVHELRGSNFAGDGYHDNLVSALVGLQF